MKGIKIVSTGRCLPSKYVSNDDFSKQLDTSDEWIRSRTGIKGRYKCQEETCLSMATMAAKKAIDKAKVDKEEIGVLIVATQTPDYIFPSTASLVQKNLGMGEEVMAFDIAAACTGFLMALGTARGLLEASPKRYALIIGSEELSRILDYEDRSTCVLFGDGAGAVLIENGSTEFLQRAWSRGNVSALNCPGPGYDNIKLSMKGNEVFKFAVTALEQGIEEILSQKKITMDDLDYCICHQANERIIRHVMKKYPGHEEKFYMNIDKYGNTSAASIPIVLDELNDMGKLKEGTKILCVAFGAGLIWTGVYLEL